MTRLAAFSPAPLDSRAASLMTLLSFIWGLQQVSLKMVAGEASPMLMIAIRSVVAAGLLVALMVFRDERAPRDRWAVGALAGGLFGLEYLLVATALQLTQASHVVIFLYTAPVFAALGLQGRLPAERLTGAQWCGVGLAFLGIATTFLTGHGADAATPAAAHALLGDFLALLAGASWGATTVTIRCSRLSRAPAAETLMYQLLGAIAVLTPALLLGPAPHLSLTAAVWGHLAFQSLIVSFASFLTWCWLLRRYLATRLGMFSFLTPLFGVIQGALLLDERPTASFLLGSGLVLVGIGLVSAGALVSRALMRARPQRLRRRGARSA